MSAGRMVTPPRCRFVLILAGLAVVVPARRVRAQGRCSGEVVSDTYEASSGVTPDALAVDPWLRDDGGGTGVDGVSGGLLTIDATAGGGQLTFLREEDLGGASSYYRIEATYAVVSSAPGGGGTVLSSVQDRQVNLTTDSDGNVWMMLRLPSDPSVVEPAKVDTVSPSALHDYVIDATRDGPVTLTVDGSLLTGQVTFINKETLGLPLPWNALPYLPGGGTTGYGPTVTFSFGAAGVSTEWQRAHFEACRPGNVAVAIQTVVPPPGASRVLKGGMGETLDGLTGLTATLDRVDVVEETVPGDASTAQVITVSNGPQPVTFATSLDDTSIRPMTNVQIPPGTVTQVRLVVSGMTIELRGATYPVKVPSGAQTGIKVRLENGALDVPQGGRTGIVIELPIFHGLIRNRGQGFVMPPVMRYQGCRCLVDDLTGECTSIENPTCGESGGGGNSQPVVEPMGCTAGATTVRVPFDFDTAKWLDQVDDRAACKPGCPTPRPLPYQRNQDITIRVAGDRTIDKITYFPDRLDISDGDLIDFDYQGFAGRVRYPPGISCPRCASVEVDKSPPWEILFRSDGDTDISDGAKVSWAELHCDPSGTALPPGGIAPFLLDTPSAEMGVLRGTGDAVFFRVSASDLTQWILLHARTTAVYDSLAGRNVPAPNFDILAWHGSLFHVDGSILQARRASSQEFLRLPPGAGAALSDWTVAVVSASGKGSFVIKRTTRPNAYFLGGRDLTSFVTVGTAHRVASPGAGRGGGRKPFCSRAPGCRVCFNPATGEEWEDPPGCVLGSGSGTTTSRGHTATAAPDAFMEALEQGVCKGLKKLYSASEGAATITRAEIWLGTTTCGSFPSSCDILVHQSRGRARCTCCVGHLPDQPCIDLYAPNGDLEDWTFAHEMSHWLLHQPDEYQSDTGVPMCGHTIMASVQGLVRSFCTDFSHGKDGGRDPNTGQQLSATGASGWDYIGFVSSAAHSVKTFDSLSFLDDDFGGQLILERMNYTGLDGSRIRVCK